ncbi:glutathione S-transferase-like protein [Tanacetum coccineum]
MATPPVKVFGPPLSTAVSRVLVCLLEKAVPFQLFPVSMAKGEHKKPDYLKLARPFGSKCSGISDDDITFFESRAICRYIAEKYANKGTTGLYGTNPLVKASIDQWLEARVTKLQSPL